MFSAFIKFVNFVLSVLPTLGWGAVCTPISSDESNDQIFTRILLVRGVCIHLTSLYAHTACGGVFVLHTRTKQSIMHSLFFSFSSSTNCL